MLHQFSSEEDDVAKNSYQIRNCGGCVRASAENKQFALTVSRSTLKFCWIKLHCTCNVFQILGEDKSVMVVLAASDEEELTQWMQTLCEAVIEREVSWCYWSALL